MYGKALRPLSIATVVATNPEGPANDAEPPPAIDSGSGMTTPLDATISWPPLIPMLLL